MRWLFKGALSGLRPFLATESALEMMTNVLKSPSVLKIFKLLS